MKTRFRVDDFVLFPVLATVFKRWLRSYDFYRGLPGPSTWLVALLSCAMLIVIWQNDASAG